MILLPCPYCGLRNAAEYRYVGEVSERPDPNETGVEEWRAFLYMRDNPAGWTSETWFHSAGCRQHLIAERNTMTNEVQPSRFFSSPPSAKQPPPERSAGGGAFYCLHSRYRNPPCP